MWFVWRQLRREQDELWPDHTWTGSTGLPVYSTHWFTLCCRSIQVSDNESRTFWGCFNEHTWIDNRDLSDKWICVLIKPNGALTHLHLTSTVPSVLESWPTKCFGVDLKQTVLLSNVNKVFQRAKCWEISFYQLFKMVYLQSIDHLLIYNLLAPGSVLGEKNSSPH